MAKRRRQAVAKGSIPRQYALVRFVYDDIPAEHHSQYPFTRQGIYVFLGEIPNMPGHCVVAEHPRGQIFSGYHTESFAEVPEDQA
jgi:hypothetical protein